MSQADVTSSVAFTFANARADSPEIRLSELILRPCGFRRNNKTRPIDLLIFPSPPRVKSNGLAVGRSLPVYPYQQTFSDADGMSQRCQNRKSHRYSITSSADALKRRLLLLSFSLG